MEIPESAAGGIKEEIDRQEKVSIDAAYIHNPGFNKEWLTRQEALMIISRISGEMMFDGLGRERSKTENPKRL